MPHGTDLPRSNCWTALFERTLDVRDVLASTADRLVILAACPASGGRHDPREAIGRGAYENGSRVRGGN